MNNMNYIVTKGCIAASVSMGVSENCPAVQVFMKMHPVIHAAFSCLNHCNRFSHHPFPLNPMPCSSQSPKERACVRSCKSTALSKLQSLLLSSENSSEEDGESITLDSEQAIQPFSPSVVSILLRAISYV